MHSLTKKIIENKNIKEAKLLDSAYKLFLEKGINNTSIQDIVNEAGVAKGTFYLYFKDKYKLQEILVMKKSKKLFDEAIKHLDTNIIKNFDDQLIFVIDYIINEFYKNQKLLKIIYKDLSSVFDSYEFNSIFDGDEFGVYELFKKGIEENNIKMENPEVTFYMIIEFVSATCFNSIVKNKPLPINEYKPYIYNTIRLMLK